MSQMKHSQHKNWKNVNQEDLAVSETNCTSQSVEITPTTRESRENDSYCNRHALRLKVTTALRLGKIGKTTDRTTVGNQASIELLLFI